MKKTLSLISACAIALCASAQQEAVWSTAEGLEALGLSSEATSIAAGTVFATGEVGDFYLAYEDQGKIMDISADGVKIVKVDGVEYALTKGTTGSTNPQGIAIDKAPSAGWVYQIDAKADGWLTIFSKLSSNKGYYVFESDMPNEMATTASLLSYELVMNFQDGMIKYTLPGDEDGYFNTGLPDAAKYYDGTLLRWPEKIELGADADDVKKNGFGCIMFPVLADYSYFFCAQGSKANTNGFVYTPNKPTQVIGIVPEKTDPDTGEITTAYKEFVFVGEGGSEGVNSVAVDAIDVNAPVYNVLGQRVSNDSKGLLIQNGRKFYNR